VTFTATDNEAATTTSTTSVTVDPPIIPPVITNAAVTGTLKATFSGQVQLSCTASDQDGSVASVSVDLSLIGGPSTLALSLGAENSWIGSANVQPPSEGSHAVTFTATDDRGATATVQVNIWVAPANSPPAISDAIIAGTLVQNVAGELHLTCTVTDPDTAPASVTVDLAPVGGPAAFMLTRGSVDRWTGATRVQPASGGTHLIVFTASDPQGLTASAQASITVQNAPPGMALIPAGEFLMGNSFDSAEGQTNELPRHAVYVSPIFMGQTEVTNQQYADALNWANSQGNLITVTSGIVYKAGSGTSYPYCGTSTATSESRITWNGSTFGVISGKENHPVVHVSWYGAAAYANWRSAMESRPLAYDVATWACNWSTGYRLPTEAEWEKAARGGTAGHRFPWADADTIQHARVNYNAAGSFSYDTSPTRGTHPTFTTGTYPYTNPAKYFAANGYGLYDMAGNVFEYCNDWYAADYYAVSPYTNPRGPASGNGRAIRNGSWGDPANTQRCSYRTMGELGGRSDTRGFRLAMGTPSESFSENSSRLTGLSGGHHRPGPRAVLPLARADGRLLPVLGVHRVDRLGTVLCMGRRHRSAGWRPVPADPGLRCRGDCRRHLRHVLGRGDWGDRVVSRRAGCLRVGSSGRAAGQQVPGQ